MRPVFSFQLYNQYGCLEWQTICTVGVCRLLGRRERSSGSSGSSRGCSRHWVCVRHSRCRLDVAVYCPCTDIVEPASLVLVRINVERHCHLLTHLDIELVYLVLTKDPEATFLWIGVMSLYDIVLRFPWVASALRHTTLSR